MLLLKGGGGSLRKEHWEKLWGEIRINIGLNSFDNISIKKGVSSYKGLSDI